MSTAGMSTAVSIAANGFHFSGLEWGPPDAPLTLLLHGFPQRCTSWSAVARRLDVAGVRSIALDQRGYSPGARPLQVEAYALTHLVADVAAMIETLGAPVHLAGHDWGGVVGWQVAARRPELVRSWTAVSTPHPLALQEILSKDRSQRERFGYIRAFRQGGIEDQLLADDAARLRSFYGGALSAAREDEEAAFFAGPGVLTAALNWYRAMARDDTADLPRVTVPTSYVWGSDDLAFGRAAAERTAAYVDGPYEFVALEGASHWLPDEAPDFVAAAIAARVLD